MSQLSLYTYWRSSAAYRVRIALNLKQLKYKAVFVNLLKAEAENHYPDYLKLNPQGLVPTLIDGKVTLNQSLAIIEYLDEHYGTTPLLPQGTKDRAWVKSLALIVCCEIHPLNNLQVLNYLNNKFLFSTAAKNKWYQHWVTEGLRAFEAHLENKQSKNFCFGEHPGLADIFLVPQMYNAHRFGCDLSKFPRLQQIEQNCLCLSEFSYAAPENQADRPT